MNGVGKAAVSQQISGAGNKYAVNTASKSGIKWTDFNYPPLLKVIHYNRSELQAPHKSIATMLWICHIFIIIISILNIINNCVQGSAFRIGLSFVFLILFNPLESICFYFGLYAFLEDDSKFLKYKILSILLGLFYIAFMIGDFGNFNGFMRIKDVDPFPVALCIIESLLFLIIALIHFFLVYKAQKWDVGPAKIATGDNNFSDPSSRKDRNNSEASQP